MSTKIRVAIAALVGVAVICIAIYMNRPASNDDFVIGVTLPLSGDAAAYGKEGLNGLNLAVEEINDNGGIDGKQIRLVVEDDRGLPKEGVSALKKLLMMNPDVQVVVGGAFSQIAFAQLPICEERGILLFSPYASTPELAKAGDCFYRNWPSDTAEGKEMADYAFGDLSLRSLAVLSSSSDYGLGLRRVFQEAFEGRGGEIRVVEEFSEGDTDFRAQLTKIKSSGVEAVYLVGWYKEFAQVLRQARELGLKVQFLSCVTFNKPELLDLASIPTEASLANNARDKGCCISELAAFSASCL